MRRQRGFTLVEVLVASAIAAILAAMAFSAMSQAMENRERIRQLQARMIAVQFTMRTLVQDFSQLVQRPVRMPVGEGYDAAVVGVRGSSSRVVLTRGGWTNPAGLPRSTLQRVRYEMIDGVLYRDYWTVLDAQPSPEPLRKPLLDGVTGFSVRYTADGRNWQETWPPPAQLSAAASQGGGTTVGPGAEQLRVLRWRPVAVEITLELADWGRLTRIIETAG